MLRVHNVLLSSLMFSSCVSSVAPSPQSPSDDFDQFDVAVCEPSASSYTATANIPAHNQPGISFQLSLSVLGPD